MSALKIDVQKTRRVDCKGTKMKRKKKEVKLKKSQVLEVLRDEVKWCEEDIAKTKHFGLLEQYKQHFVDGVLQAIKLIDLMDGDE